MTDRDAAAQMAITESATEPFSAPHMLDGSFSVAIAEEAIVMPIDSFPNWLASSTVV
jgi:hypothetical protein